MNIFDNWILLAIITPTLWALGCVLDSCLIGSKVYRKPTDGAIVSCIFCIVPALVILGSDTPAFFEVIANRGMPVAAIAAGLAFALHLFFYFRALHNLNDVSGAETFLTMSVLFVPLFAWVLLDERLPVNFYLALALAATGVLLQCLPVVRRIGLPLLINMLMAVLTVSLAMVLQAMAMESHGFVAASVCFNLTAFCVAATCLVVHCETRMHIVRIYRSHLPILALGEVFGVLAVMSSHRATQQGPSVSLVALIECLLPLIIIVISTALITFNRFWPLLSIDHHSTLALQLQGIHTKLTALSLLVGSFFLLNI